MSYAIACSKIWNPDLVKNLEVRLQTTIYFLSQKEDLTVENLKANNISKIFFPHWSYIIKENIFNHFECVIFHMTDLPYGRGGSPLQNLIVRGHKYTKISALKCSEGIDTGPIYLKADLDLSGTAGEIFQRATRIIEDMIVKLIVENPAPQKQTGDIVEFQRRTPSDGNLINIKEIENIYDHIRMLDAENYPNAFLENENIKYEFHSAQLNEGMIEAKVRIIKK